MHKGDRNNFIKESFELDGILFKIIDFHNLIFCRDKPGPNIIIQNEYLVKMLDLYDFVDSKFVTITFDYDIKYIELDTYYDKKHFSYR